MPTASPALSNCFDWRVTQHFHFAQRGLVNSRLDFSRYPCDSKLMWEWGNYVWVNIIVLGLCTIRLLMGVKYINDIGQRYKKLKRRYQQRYEEISEEQHQKRNLENQMQEEAVRSFNL